MELSHSQRLLLKRIKNAEIIDIDTVDGRVLRGLKNRKLVKVTKKAVSLNKAGLKAAA